MGAEPGVGFYEALLRGLTDGLLLTDEDGTVLWASDAAARLLDRDVDDIVGRNTVELQHPEDAELSLVRRAEIATGPRPNLSSMRRVIQRNGTWRSLDCTSIDLRQVPEIGGLVIVLRDATERHQRWESERRLKALVENAQDAVIVYGRDLHVAYASPAVHELMDDLSGTVVDQIDRFIAVDQRAEALASLSECVDHPGTSVEITLLLTRTDGVSNWVEVRATNLLEDPAVAGIVMNGRNVTEERALHEQMTTSERRYRAMVEHVDDAIVIVDAQGRYRYQSPGSLRHFGPLDLVEDRLAAIAHPDELDDVRAMLEGAFAAEQGATVEHRFRFADLDGDFHWFDLRATNLSDEPAVGGVVINGRDVSAEVGFEARLRAAARADPLTGLPNRTSIVEHLEAALRRARDPSTVVVLFLDLDRFKVVNDSFGHATGDRVLVELGARLQEAVGPDAMVGRFGGDEYVVLAEAASAEVAVGLADVLARTASQPFTVIGPDSEQAEVYLSGSIGIALGAPSSEPSTLLHHADAAMYRAKERGRGTWELYDEGMRKAALSRLTLEAELARALDDRGFELWYQPIVDVGTGRVKGFEALARWRHRDRGLVSPAEFIPIAEETGGIHRLGAWALATACGQLRAWQSLGLEGLTLSVNLSPRQLTREELAGDIAELLASSELDPSLICLEITETLLMDDLELAVKALSRLRDTGVRLALDDFGTGWSSLTYLRSVPVDQVKVDRSFIEGVAHTADDRTIVGAVVTMCRALGKEVVAEGVETEAQYRALRELGCSFAQGYLFAKPLPAPEVPSWLNRYRTAGNRDPDAAGAG